MRGTVGLVESDENFACFGKFIILTFAFKIQLFSETSESGKRPLLPKNLVEDVQNFFGCCRCSKKFVFWKFWWELWVKIEEIFTQPNKVIWRCVLYSITCFIYFTFLFLINLPGLLKRHTLLSLDKNDWLWVLNPASKGSQQLFHCPFYKIWIVRVNSLRTSK